MSKYDDLWAYVQEDGSPTSNDLLGRFRRSGHPIDHSFRIQKRIDGLRVSGRKIPNEEQTVVFSRIVQ